MMTHRIPTTTPPRGLDLIVHGIAALLLAATMVFSSACAGEAGHPNQATVSQGEEPAMQNLIDRIKAKDPAASTLAERLGPGANPALTPFMKDADPKIRRIALYCFDKTGGPEALQAFLAGVLDENPQVRGAALAGLKHHAVESTIIPLTAAYDKSPEGDVRREIALIIGHLPGAKPGHLQARYLQEKDALAKEGCITAMAFLGDAQARTLFIDGLHASRNRDRARYMDYCEYIKQTWLLKPLAPILDDPSPMLRIGADNLPQFPEYLRAADMAVNLVAEISGRPLSFAVNKTTNYTEGQIDEVRNLLRTMP